MLQIGIVSGTAPAPSPSDIFHREVDLTDDGGKVLGVFISGLDMEPVRVSKECSRHCTNHYDIENRICAGGFGIVYQGNDLTLRRSFAFKHVSLKADNSRKIH